MKMLSKYANIFFYILSMSYMIILHFQEDVIHQQSNCERFLVDGNYKYKK